MMVELDGIAVAPCHALGALHQLVPMEVEAQVDHHVEVLSTHSQVEVVESNVD